MEKTKGKFITFLKKNAVYLVLAFCVLAVGLSVALTLIDGKTSSIDSTLDATQDSVGSLDKNAESASQVHSMPDFSGAP